MANKSGSKSGKSSFGESDTADEQPGSVRSMLRLPPEAGAARDFVLAANPAASPLAPGGKKKTTKALVAQGASLAELQERLYAAGKGGDTSRVLLVLQGMDTSGKGGVISHVIGLVNPQGVQLHSFKAPTAQEATHHFLWRIARAAPTEGMIGIFDRSHYEDVLIVRVHDLVPEKVWRRRFAEINRFEQRLADEGTTIIKCFLNVSLGEQRSRLLARLDDPTKHWKYNPGDVDERQRWAEYQAAYLDALVRCNSADAPWYVVPADHKWYRNWAVGQLLFETLADLDPQYPSTTIDVEKEKARIAAGI